MQEQLVAGGISSLQTLRSLAKADLEILSELGIHNIGDMLAFAPFRAARLVQAAAAGLLDGDDIKFYLDDPAAAKDTAALLLASPEILSGVGPKIAKSLRQLGIENIRELGEYLPFAEAEALIAPSPDEDSDPYAPPCVLPGCKKFTRNSKAFVSFFKQDEIRSLSVQVVGQHRPISKLFDFDEGLENKVVYLGYSVSYLQEWTFYGIHLGEPQAGSINLLMGQDTQVSVLDFRRITRANRTENTAISERLSNVLLHQRAVDEVARATAEEHQFGATGSFGANAATAGSFTAAGAVVGGIGGGISGAVAGLVLGNVANVALGAPTIAGTAAGTAIGSVAGAAAGSLIFSGATALGFVATDAEGDRDIFARSAQDIQQRTLQNSSSLRSLWSSIVSSSLESEQQTISTERVTNHNRIHALNALYFEVLNEYRVNIAVSDYSAILFLPFKAIYFQRTNLRLYWWIIRTALADLELVAAVDKHCLSLSTDPSPAGELAELPDIEDVKSTKITVELNLDGNAMQDLVVGGLAAIGLTLTGNALLAAVALVVRFFTDQERRKKIKVKLLTSDGERSFDLDESPNDNPNYIGTYELTDDIRIHTIRGIKIRNTNDEAELDLGVAKIDFNELAFEAVSVELRVKSKSSLNNALPEIGALERNTDLSGGEVVEIGAGKNKELTWDVATRLSEQFAGINEQREVLEAELADDELTEAKINNLIGFLNANRYGFTRFILTHTESEQVSEALESVQIGGVHLSTIAGTTPLGFCGNHVVLPLRNCEGRKISYGPLTIDTRKLEAMLGKIDDLDFKKPKDFLTFVEALVAFLRQFIVQANGSAKSALDAQLLDLLEALLRVLNRIEASADQIDRGSLAGIVLLRTSVARLEKAIANLLAFLNAPLPLDSKDTARFCEFFNTVRSKLQPQLGRTISSSEVSLPSPAIFMEPLLSHAKGAELYDLRRNSHYDLLPAPGIGDADPNVLRGRDIVLTPTVPTSNLVIQNPPDLPLPTSILTALSEAGKLDLSALINSNANTLTSTLTNLSSLATELAKASATLTGDAQQQALTAATDVAKQIGAVLEKGLTPAPAPAPPKEAPPAPKPQPPVGLPEKAPTLREIDRINKTSDTPEQKREKKETLGVPVAPSTRLDYTMTIEFLAELGKPFPFGVFTVEMLFQEFDGPPTPIDGGAEIPMSRGLFRFPGTFNLEKGRLATISIKGKFGAAGSEITGIKTFKLPETKDVTFKARMITEEELHETSTMKSAVDQSIQNSAFKVGLGILLDSMLSVGGKIPFMKVFEINASGTQKLINDFKGEYTSGSTDTDTDTTTDTSLRKFKVIKPTGVFEIEVIT